MARRRSRTPGREGDELLELGKRLRRQADGQAIVKELQKALREGAKPIVPATRERARAILPRSGGLAEKVAKAPQRVTARVGNTTATVRVTVAGKKSGAYGANQGRVRHLVYGRPGSWVTQNVTPGWHTDAAEQEAPKARDEIVEVMSEFARRLTRPL